MVVVLGFGGSGGDSGGGGGGGCVGYIIYDKFGCEIISMPNRKFFTP